MDVRWKQMVGGRVLLVGDEDDDDAVCEQKSVIYLIFFGEFWRSGSGVFGVGMKFFVGVYIISYEHA